MQDQEARSRGVVQAQPGQLDLDQLAEDLAPAQLAVLEAPPIVSLQVIEQGLGFQARVELEEVL